MAAHTSTHLRSLYRSLLRELPPRPILKVPRSPLHAYLRGIFASSGAPSSPSSSASSPSTSSPITPTAQHHQARAEAEQLVTYLRWQRQYVALIERYNPGLGMDEESVSASPRAVSAWTCPSGTQPAAANRGAEHKADGTACRAAQRVRRGSKAGAGL
ncbi:hypothetical protein JDV02_003145 [Purpureocillium takamizusanense]|uniref:Uncharacterized protein n=1 Tax=Purpureocillium takamizusanense TaxID=2060973 RepID=A0A9Q8QBV5_9HYPO|nr:uncharacterized protein JDV02_003145 [Purpureocillium takamizusanense]UNI16735.1 hypothetical protein JDV02_003145 [Purpureocillium takamizusanense]